MATNRTVFTYEPDGWPVGLLTGHPDNDGGFAVEHVVAFRPGVLLPMLRAALAEAWNREYRHVTFGFPHAFRLTPGLRVLAARLGATAYQRDDRYTHFVIYREAR